MAWDDVPESMEEYIRAILFLIHEEDEEESGVFAVINKKIDKSRSFPFMNEYSNLFILKLEQMSATQ